MNRIPKITVVTPSFNQGQYIEQTIISVLSQSYPELEYIVMDGGSTDESVDIIKKYSDKISYWQSMKDDGQAAAIMQGFQRSTGEILCWVNSDDILLPGALMTVAEEFYQRSQMDCLIGSTIIIDGSGKPINHFGLIPSFTVGDNVTFHKLLHYGCSFNQPSAFFRRSAFFASGGFDVGFRFSFDYDLFLRLSSKQAIGSTGTYLSAFRMHDTNKSTVIQDVCYRENRILWERNGRYQKSALLSGFFRGYYTLENYFMKYYGLILHFKKYHNAISYLRRGGMNAP